ncbi:class I SAM-dependent methyltransferase [Paenibacillus chartarius]|uniref:Class I SAM-dependent methyltransferase n=1 Tax=Paenibacillus chartarius TaxID=747481 RepID=A0ABV6DVN0_9BACL
MPNHTHIYEREAGKYDELVSKQPDVSMALQSLCSIAGKEVIELGAGAGRLTVPLARLARTVAAFDASDAMLRLAAAKLRQEGLANWTVQTADHRAIPAETGSADVLVAGWTIGYIANSTVPSGMQNLAAVMSEVQRVLRPGGTALIIETLGTGVAEPAPPDFLTAYYEELERTYGYRRHPIRTDYRFDDAAQAAELIRFFFGEELGAHVAARRLTVVPECAGIWIRVY